jgi:hypothetical protein
MRFTGEQETVRQRLAEYHNEDSDKQRARLIEAWKKHHPEAAAEQPSYMHPLISLAGWRQRKPDQPQEMWHNDIYAVSVRRHSKDPVFGTEGGMIQLGISTHDGTARHDWRDFQAIKNQLAGAECEAFELYPAESRLLDPSNYYSLWCFPGVKRLKIGQPFRQVLDADEALAPQRAFGKDPSSNVEH